MRIDELAAAAGGLEEERFGSQCRRLMQEYQRQERREEALRIFGGLFERASAQEKRASWLGISSLHTSVQTGKTEYLLAVYGEEFYLDPAPVGRYWTPSVFQECMEEDIRAVIKELRSRFPRIWQYEEPYPGEGAVRLDERKMKGLPFFQIWVKDRKKTVIRMDLAESLLMRHAVGLELQEVVIT